MTHMQPQPTQAEKAHLFQSLHREGRGFLIPNPWDPGSARLLASLGFKALATTSAGFAFSRGQADGSVTRGAMMRHLADLVASTDLPISADLGDGFGSGLQDVANSILEAAEAGVVGGSIEDSTGQAASPILAIDVAVERVAAAVQAARSLPFPFTVTARAENYFVGVPDLKDTIKRLQAFQEAGADVLFAPGLSRVEDIAEVLKSVDRPLNVLLGMAGLQLSAPQLLDMGVKRLSVGGSLARAAMGALQRAATELMTQGTTAYTESAMRGADLNQLFAASPR